MPELPEVEIFKRYLDATSLHQRIDAVDVRNTYILKETSVRQLARGLKGRRFESSRRHGKHLFVRADGELWLRLHFGMTGSLQYFKKDKQAPQYARVLFVFANNHCLAFDDQRQFGQIGLLKNVDEFLKEHELGPDALKIDLPEFKKILGKRRGAVKSVLLNQRIIAVGPSSLVLDPEVLSKTYGGHLLVLGNQAVVMDDAHHHDSASGGEQHYHERPERR